jgi:hypothetical protein
MALLAYTHSGVGTVLEKVCQNSSFTVILSCDIGQLATSVACTLCLCKFAANRPHW